jgi:hypothetical protein
VIALAPVVLVLAGVVERQRDQLLDQVRQGRRTVGDDLDRLTVRCQGCREEPAGRGDIPMAGDEDVDDLAVLVDRAVHVPPDTVDLDVRLVDEPPFPALLRHGRAASINSGVNRSTHRNTVT